MTITILKTEQFQPLGKPIPRPAAPAPEPVQIKPGIWQLPDGRLETRDPAVDLIVNGGYGGTKPGPKAPETPLAVLPNALGDGWTEWRGGECPIDLPCKWQLRHRNGKEFDSDIDPRGYSTQWRHTSPDRGAHIVAYRILPKEPA